MLLERGRGVKLPESAVVIARGENVDLLRESDFVDDGLGGGARIFRG
jgi:hypothetical protein